MLISQFFLQFQGYVILKGLDGINQDAQLFWWAIHRKTDHIHSVLINKDSLSYRCYPYSAKIVVYSNL